MDSGESKLWSFQNLTIFICDINDHLPIINNVYYVNITDNFIIGQHVFDIDYQNIDKVCFIRFIYIYF